ncbi:hypothetical protein ECC02_010620 [Trypanosoma cruzi]|uniref:Uncharacterized protein n=1 Tax=Trypanosoma cruzi TaxID=5693 RepID=A0A7J6XQU1_TRYCR|nr:hypothetical protein ECC02_011568 [Trypanosoma cruzi]KAF5216583.1 hypothetical protein ECC02_010620 [Trypanosoma cruzi]
MCRHIHREGNGGPFPFRCTAGSTVATCVHRIGHMAHSTQLTIPAMHAHIKATESIILILSLSTGSRTLLPRPHTHARESSGRRHSEHTTNPPRASHPQERRLGLGAPSSFLPFMPTEEAAATRNRQHTLQKNHPNPLQCAFCACMWLCVPADARSKEVKTGAEHVKGRTNQNVQQRCMAEIKRKKLLRLTILHCSPSSGNSLKN